MLEQGFPICRVRHHGETARIEIPAEQIQEIGLVWPYLAEAFAAIGFASVELDDEGFISGKLNRAIGKAGSEVGL
jgi:uncharacterized protein